MKISSSLKRTLATAGFILILCFAGCKASDSTPLALPVWKTFQQEMLDKYSCIDKLEANENWHQLVVWCYCENISQDDKEYLKAELKSFLSSEEFLAEYISFVRETYVSSDNHGVQEYLPDITIHLAVNGSTKAEWMSEAMYYTISYRSDQVMEIDNYQTWYDLDYDE